MSLTYAEISRRINREFQKRREWAGVPMPLPGLGLVVEPKHPAAEMIAELQRIVDEDHPRPVAPALTDDDKGWRIVNEWRGRTRRGVTGRILILRHEDGRTSFGVDSDLMKRNTLLFGPLDSFDAWHLDTELTAIDRLATLVNERQFAAYVLTGSFLEQSKRSRVAYMFRRCRPTIAMSVSGGRRMRPADDDDTGVRILACLCLHPIGYYARTFAGAMVPTDDVIAHLMLMRGDEHLFWRRANQHHPADPESGL